MGAQQGSFKNITGTRFDADGKLSVGAHKVFLECVCKSGQRTQREAFVYIPDLPLNGSFLHLLLALQQNREER